MGATKDSAGGLLQPLAAPCTLICNNDVIRYGTAKLEAVKAVFGGAAAASRANVHSDTASRKQSLKADL